MLSRPRARGARVFLLTTMHPPHSPAPSGSTPRTVAWLSFFPVEWLDEVPEEVARVPKDHPATWQQVLLAELERDPRFRLHVFALRSTYARSLEFERRGVRFHLVKTPRGWRSPSYYWVDTWLLWRALRRLRPDVVHAWGTEGGAALVAKRLGYPYVVTMQGLLSWIRTLVPLGRYHRFAARLEDWSLRGAPVVTTESNFAVDYLRRRHPGLRVEQVEHPPKPLFQTLARQPQREPLRLVFTGNPSQIKGTDLLLRALDRVRDELAFELVIVAARGQGFLEAMRAAVSTALWSRVRLLENVPSETVAAELARATMMVFPTRADTSPNSVKEAVVAGVPVVASRIGGLVDYVLPDKNGVLFEPDNLEACVGGIREAARHPLFREGRVDAATLAWARDYLSAARMGRRFAEIYHSLAPPPS